MQINTEKLKGFKSASISAPLAVVMVTGTTNSLLSILLRQKKSEFSFISFLKKRRSSEFYSAKQLSGAFRMQNQ